VAKSGDAGRDCARVYGLNPSRHGSADITFAQYSNKPYYRLMCCAAQFLDVAMRQFGVTRSGRRP
jgi:hypothetical protein